MRRARRYPSSTLFLKDFAKISLLFIINTNSLGHTVCSQMLSSYWASLTSKPSPAPFGAEIFSTVEVNEVEEVPLTQYCSRILDQKRDLDDVIHKMRVQP